MSRTPGQHTAWCARTHACNLSEHRADPVTLAAPGAGTAVITRVRGADGRDYAEIRLRIDLPAAEPAARQRLTAVLTHLRTLIGPPRIGRRAA
jgi:hypothetical protein